MKRSTALALGLWIALGVVVWNVVFDYEVRTAARQYVYEATLAFRGEAPPVGMDEMMRPAIARGVRLGTEWGGGLAVAGLAAIAWAGRRRTSGRPPGRRDREAQED
ncbi:MAG: hypothetical protein KGN76_09165 [Acidobacteriota bacterium]|nr:hypothetical protein [Acidobacteriota bacterium]